MMMTTTKTTIKMMTMTIMIDGGKGYDDDDYDDL